jgi:DNA-binding transcriptional MerR regulator
MLIGEVAEQSGISTRMLRHYDRLGVVSPSERTSGGYRHYTDDDLRRLFHVEALRSLGLSLKEIAAVLDEPSFVPGAVVDRLAEQTRARIAAQQDLLATLERVRGSDPADWGDVLRTLGLLRGLDSDAPSTRQRVALSMSDPAGRDGPLLTEAALAETDPVAAGALLWALARAGDTTVPQVAAALDSDDEQRRHRAVEALEKIHSDRALCALAAALGHRDPWVERRAALAAGARGIPEASPLWWLSSSPGRTTAIRARAGHPRDRARPGLARRPRARPGRRGRGRRSAAARRRRARGDPQPASEEQLRERPRSGPPGGRRPARPADLGAFDARAR